MTAALVMSKALNGVSANAVICAQYAAQKEAGTNLVNASGPGPRIGHWAADSAEKTEASRTSTHVRRAVRQMRKNQRQPRKSIDLPSTELGENHSALAVPPVVTEEEALREAQEHTVFLARSEIPGESARACIRRASQLSGLSYARVERFYYAKHDTVVRAHELDQLRSRVEWERTARIRRLQAELDLLKRLEREPA